MTARGFLYTLSDNSYWLVGVQLLDGIGAGIFGALFPLSYRTSHTERDISISASGR